MKARELYKILQKLDLEDKLTDETTLVVIQDEERLIGQQADRDWWSEVVRVKYGSNTTETEHTSWVEIITKKDGY